MVKESWAEPVDLSVPQTMPHLSLGENVSQTFFLLWVPEVLGQLSAPVPLCGVGLGWQWLASQDGRGCGGGGRALHDFIS